MITKLVAGACVLALAAITQSAVSRSAERSISRPLVVRASLPLPFGGERGYASFASDAFGAHWYFAASWSGGKEHERLTLRLASEPNAE